MSTQVLERRAVSDATMRHVMGAFPSGVTVLTTRHEGRPVGVTISSFASVSLDPPLVLLCLSRTSASLPAFAVGRPVVVNILGSEHAGLARRFASRVEDRFAGVPSSPDARGVPVLDGTAAWVAGTVDRVDDAGDHVLLLVRVDEAGRNEVPPLLYHSGTMHEWPAVR